ncbi:UvrD-helicase domain-containing protein [Sphingobacterium sp. SGG-5]|uniref:UvrD-helicase domain-containing protein n=1 Tax=Sphingobacterium sp. SGG-5 TaxID=2710881 RepID=UPI0013EE33AD|nr:UvrD-helicase domain-containing protein [Sphingobacterium sp. SGG-5]NGM60480.1 UvrD-helicase domain-containing protein [Sphingobacterium sp. SGG-5]
MTAFYNIIAAIGLAFIGFFVFRHRYRRNKQYKDAERLLLQQQIEQYKNHLEQYASQINYIAKQILPFNTRYCSWTDLHNKTAEIQSTVPTVDIPPHYEEENELHDRYLEILNYSEKSADLRTEHNTAFIQTEKLRCQNYFASLLSNPLDEQQIDAILHDDDNTLVIAGAGCGKTTTVQGKVSYLLNHGLASPKEILLLSFAKKNAEDLKEKLGYLGVTCRTFHSLAYQIIKGSDRAPDVILPEEAEQIILQSHLSLINDAAYLASFNDIILNGLRPIKHENEFSNYKEYIQYLKDCEFESLKGMLFQKQAHQHNNGKTLRSEFVKSGEECYIANFLFLNGVEYSYESPYIFHKEIDASVDYDKNKKRYRPDFTIYLNGYDEYSIKSCPNPQENVLYLEHYGIDENGDTPPFFEGRDGLSPSEYYRNIMQWKDEVHGRYKTTLIKSYSYEFKNKTVEEHLVENLIKHGVQLSPKSNEEIYDILQDAYTKEIDAVIQLVNTFIGLLKSNNKSFDELEALNRKLFLLEPNMMARNVNLLDMIRKIHQQYEAQLKHLHKLDFNDLINQAKDKLDEGTYIHPYKYIIVDEFQDISINRYQLLNALKKQSYCKLFAVGDDWQSIYRFSGSDLTLFKHFEEYFGHTVTKKIETTYRFAEPLIQISSNFILKNPNQAEKTLRAGRPNKTEVMFEYRKKDEQEINQNVLDILQQLYMEYGEDLADKSITLLGRYNHDIRQLKNDSQIMVDSRKSCVYVRTVLHDKEVDGEGNTIRDNQLQFEKTIDFLTVHRAKGLESDIVILINCETGKYGFPAELSDDRILSLLLSGDDRYPNGEERRAFYVALTRAKEKFVFLANKNRQSKFLREIYAEHRGDQEEALCCERCEAELQFIKKIKNKFGLSQMFGCTNYKYGCDYTTFVRETEPSPLFVVPPKKNRFY